MSIIFILILISLFIAMAFLAAFFWAVKSGQYEDNHTPGMRILLDSDAQVRGQVKKSTNKGQTSNQP